VGTRGREFGRPSPFLRVGMGVPPKAWPPKISTATPPETTELNNSSSPILKLPLKFLQNRAMRALLCFLAAIGIAQAQDLKETYGKTNAQILAMGYDKWYDFFTSKAGETTQGMAQTGYKYAAALRWRNNGLEAKLPAARRKTISRLRTAIDDFGTSVIQVERALNGGGTLWFITFSSNAMDVEQTIYGLVGGKVKPAKPIVVSMVTKELATLESEFKAASPDAWKFEFRKEDTAKRLATAKKSFEIIVNIAKTLDRAKSDLLLTYCRDAIVNSKMQAVDSTP
jgi:hypothetical protein